MAAAYPWPIESGNVKWNVGQWRIGGPIKNVLDGNVMRS